MKPILFKALSLASAAVMGLAAPQAMAADFPSKPIRIVAPFLAGVTTDIVARTVADALTARLGKPVIVDNKAGADGVIGVMDVVKAAPDGHTLLVVTNGPLSAVPNLKKNPPYDVLKDLTPISDIGRATFAVYVAAEVPAKTLPEFIEYAKANPGMLNYASGNLTGQLSFAYMAMKAGLDMAHIPYKGETNAMNDMIGGRVQAIVATLGTGLPMVEAGKLRILAVIAGERNAEIPDVPLISEAGFQDFPIQSWFGMFGPAGMPPDVVTKLNVAMTDALNDPAVLKRLKGMRTEVTSSTPEGLAVVLRAQLEAHGKIIRDAGISLE